MSQWIQLGNGYTFNGVAYTREIYKPCVAVSVGGLESLLSFLTDDILGKQCSSMAYEYDKNRATKVSDLVGEYIIQTNELFSIFLLENIWKITDYYYDDQTDVCYLRYLAKNIVTDEEKEVYLGSYRILNFTERKKIHKYQHEKWEQRQENGYEKALKEMDMLFSTLIQDTEGDMDKN
jgi:hypothetical protein